LIENIKTLLILQVSTGYPKNKTPPLNEKWGFEIQRMVTAISVGCLIVKSSARTSQDVECLSTLAAPYG
jgi:hypothetical protein